MKDHLHTLMTEQLLDGLYGRAAHRDFENHRIHESTLRSRMKRLGITRYDAAGSED